MNLHPLRHITLGVLGGGQLGRMFCHAAQAMGYRVVVLEPDRHSPAAAAADEHLAAAYDDPDALDELARRCTAVTTEFENVPADALHRLAAHCVVAPGAAAVRVCQHRAAEKRLFAEAGVPCAPWAEVGCSDDLTPAAAAVGFPAILKTARLGYDGKGQQAVPDAAALPAAWAALGRQPCVLEQRLPLRLEFSLIVARGADGQTVHLPAQQNLHRDGILALTQVPAPDVPASVVAQAQRHTQALAERLQYVGVLCVEFFVLADGRLVANEMAPRPHNSGHASIDACDLSQFDLQLRALAGLPLVSPRQHSAAVMLNLLGELWFEAGSGSAAGATAVAEAALRLGPGAAAADCPPARTPPWAAALALPGMHLHLYGKLQPRPGRKMGHLTVTAATPEAAREVALTAARCLGLPAF